MDPNEGLTWSTLYECVLRKPEMSHSAPFPNGRDPRSMAAEQTANILRAVVKSPAWRTLTGPVTPLRGPIPLKLSCEQ